MTDLQHLHDDLIGWFEENKEDLPWRLTGDPYRIWLSEIMLQQTQIETVIPYYERFLSFYPTVEDLAAASLDEVLKLWEGLGYYSRARNLHKAARMVVEEFDGAFPRTIEGLRRLPGIGPYTAGAVGSIAFNLNAPVVDGNVIRVFARWFNVEDDIRQTGTRNAMWQRAEAILPEGRAGAWNEALMELGQKICRPRSPDCSRCPVSAHCEAYTLGVQEDRPVKSPKAPVPHYDVTAAVIRHPEDNRLLIAQRPLEGMLGGLWEFPGGKRDPNESLTDCLKREIREELDIEIKVGGQITTVKHAYTHFRITLYAYACELVSGKPRAVECADFAWAADEELDSFAFPVTDQKIIAALRNGTGQLAMDLEG